MGSGGGVPAPRGDKAQALQAQGQRRSRRPHHTSGGFAERASGVLGTGERISDGETISFLRASGGSDHGQLRSDRLCST